MIIYLGFIFNTFLFLWYSDKLLNNQMTEQYWHIPQMIMLIGFYLMPIIVAKERIKYLVRLAFYGCCFPFMFNVGLNLYRGLPITHLGKYDFLNFKQTVVIFLFGLLGSIGYECWLKAKNELSILKDS